MKIFLRILGIISLVSFCLLTLLLVFLPSLLSSSFGKSFILDRINRNIQGKITIEKLHFSWLGNQNIENVKLIDTDSTPIFSADRISGDFSLFTFLFDNALRKLSLQNVNAVIVTDEEGNTNFERIFTKKPSSKPIWNAPIYLKDVNVDLTNNGREFFLKGKGETLQQSLHGSFVIDAEYGEIKKLQLNAKNFPVLFFDQLLSIQRPKLKGMLLNSLGEKINELIVVTNDNNISLEAFSPTTQAHIKGHFKKDNLYINSESQILINLPKENTANILSIYSFSIFGNPLTNLIAQVNFKDLSVPLLKQKINQLDGEILIHLDPIEFDRKLVLKDAVIASVFPHKEDRFSLRVNGNLERDQKPYAANLLLSFDKKILLNTKLLDQRLTVDGHIEADGTLIEIKGTRNNGKTKLSIFPKKENFPHFALELSQKGKNFFPIEGHLVIKDIPEGFLNMEEIFLPFKANANRLNFEFKAYSRERKNLIEGTGYAFNWFKDGKIDFDNIEAETNFDLFETDFLNTGHFFKGTIQTNLAPTGQFAANIHLTGSKQALVKSIQGALIGNRKSQEIAFNFEADSSFLKGSLIHKDWSFKPITLGLEGQLQQLPIAFLCPLIDAKICKKGAAIFGQFVDGMATIAINDGNGLLSLALKGSNGSFQLNGNVKDNQLYLTDSLKAEVKITRDFEMTILKDLVPFLVPIVAASEPIKVEIAKENFKLPLSPFSFEEMSIGKGQIQFPKITVGIQSQLLKAISLIGIHRDVEVLFTPLYFNLYKSIINLQRVDMLIDQNYPIAAWGSMDFIQDKVKMNVGISGTALTKAFTIQGLSQTYMLPIPLRGTISNPQLDTRKAAARLAALVAQQSGGKIFGTVLEAANSAFIDDKIPAPTTNPLPWNLENSKNSEPSEEEKSSMIEKPLKALEKEARKFIKGM